MDTKNAAQSRNDTSGASQEAPAMDALHCDFLSAYLTAIRPSSLEVVAGEVTLTLWYKALSSFYHARVRFDLVDMPQDDDAIIELCSRSLGDLLADVQEISAACMAALYDRLVVEMSVQSCYHKLTRSESKRVTQT